MKPDATRESAVDRMVFLARQLGNAVQDPERERRFVATLGSRLVGERAAGARQRIGLGMALAAAVLLGPVIGVFALRESDLSYRLNGIVVEKGYLVGKEHAEVLFSDGSKIELLPGASAQVDDVTAHGATLRLAQGSVALDIVKATGNAWTVQAGPYQVHVIGTAFDVHWSEAARFFEVDLHRGSVAITGPGIVDELRLEPGQRLISGDKGLQVTRAELAARASVAPAMEPTVAQPAPDAVVLAQDEPGAEAALETVENKAYHRDSSGVASVSSTRWSAWVARGDYQRVINAAQTRGIDDVLSRGTQSELAAFADASRYARQPKLARRALLAERTRFPKAAAARGSAFFLGGIEADGSAAALKWFETYLAEAPNGSYVPQALGRRMMIVHRQRGKSESSALARDYLKRFPQGPYAAAARQILGLFSE